jgi:spermidine synthase
MGWFSLFFVISGFCGLLYEIVWLRLAMAAFGVTTALVSLVLSTFMAGLGLGAMAGGRFAARARRGSAPLGLRFYAATELLIGASALVVPRELAMGRYLMTGLAISSSLAYYAATAAALAVTLLPWCTLMGATFPVAMASIPAPRAAEPRRTFSFLYVANLGGAVAGATLPLGLIELGGFHRTLAVAGVLNALLAALAFALDRGAFSRDRSPAALAAGAPPMESRPAPLAASRDLLALLFLSGLTSMGMEVVWIRQLTPYLGTMVYAFALILAVYLAASFAGARAYRARPAGRAQVSGALWSLVGLAALIPLITTHPSLLVFRGSRWLRLLAGVAPPSFLFGYVTPMLVDRWAGDDPQRAGRGYAANILGCIVGPLTASFLLLPLLGERRALFLLALPWLLLPWLRAGTGAAGVRPPAATSLSRAFPVAAIAAGGLALVLGKGFEDQFAQALVLRDSTATVVAANDRGRLRLIVNGQGMSYLSPITKVMAHLPLASLDHPPARGLVICFGMGTTFRSMLSWGIPTTVAELVPSVPRTIGFFHADGPRLLESPLARVVIDDGRRFLERTQDSFDVITIDPPPPIQAAGSSLLYSTEFYAAARKRLAPGGILAQWLPEGDALVQQAVAGALRASFAYVRSFEALDGGSGRHFLASDRPIAPRTPADLLRRMPAAAISDLMEWGPAGTPARELALTLDREVPLAGGGAAAVPPLADDHPVNEYFILRRLRARHR